MQKYRVQPWAMPYKESGFWNNLKKEVNEYIEVQVDKLAGENAADDILILEDAFLPIRKNGIWNRADLRIIVEAGEKEHLKHCIIREKERADKNKEGDLGCYGNPDRQFDIKGRRASFYKKFNEHTKSADYTLRHNYENDDSFDRGVFECVRLITAKNKETQSRRDNIGGTVGL